MKKQHIEALLVAMNQLIYKADSMGSDADLAIANVLADIANDAINHDDDDLNDVFINIVHEFNDRCIEDDSAKVNEIFKMIQDS